MLPSFKAQYQRRPIPIIVLFNHSIFVITVSPLARLQRSCVRKKKGGGAERELLCAHFFHYYEIKSESGFNPFGKYRVRTLLTNFDHRVYRERQRVLERLWWGGVGWIKNDKESVCNSKLVF